MAYRIHRIEEMLRRSPDLVDAAYQWVLDKEAKSASAHSANNAGGRAK
jgi:hypothetical protein